MPMTQPDGAITTVAAGANADAIFSADGSRLYAVSGNTVTVINVADGSTITSYTIGTQLGAIDISQDGRHLAIVEELPGGGTGTLYRVDLTNGSISTFNISGTSALQDVAFLADGSVVISQEVSAPLRVVYLTTGDFWEASGSVPANATIIVSTDATYFIAQAPTITLPLYAFDTEVGSGYGILGRPDPYGGASVPDPGSCVGAVSPDGSLVIQGTSLRVYQGDFSTSFSLGDMYPELRDPAALVFSPDGDKLYLLSANPDQIVVFDTATWDGLATYPVGAYAFHPSAWPAGTPLPGEMMRVSDDGQFLSVITPTGIQLINLSLVIEETNEGDDIIAGGTGNDSLIGGAGADTIDGGDGNDQLASHDIGVASDSADPISLDIYAEHDVINGGAGSDNIFAGYGDDVDGGADGFDGDSLFISFLGAPSGVTLDFSLASQTIGGGTIIGIENLRWVQGSNFADTINAADNASHYAGGNSVLGMGGDDHLIAGYYTYMLDGGDGDDLVDGRPGEILTSVHGGAGNDTIYTNLGSSHCIAYGDAGNDEIHAYIGAYGGSGNDTIFGYLSPYTSYGLYGEEGDDSITGAEGNDYISGGSGADILIGGEGHDTIGSGGSLEGYYQVIADDMGLEHDVISAGDGNDLVWAGYGDDADGGAGDDRLRLSFGGKESGIVFDTAMFVAGGPLTIGGGTLQNFETLEYLRTTEFADVVTVSGAYPPSIDLGAGDDVVSAIFGSASIFGGEGDDRLIGSSYLYIGSVFNGGSGNDSVDYRDSFFAVSVVLKEDQGYGSTSNGDFIFSVENAFGSGFADFLQGNSQDNLLAGDDGNDRLVGGAGDDLLDGGDGVDTADYRSTAVPVTVDLSITGAQNTGGAGTDTLTGIENIDGSDFNDSLSGDANANRLSGWAGNDTLSGGAGDDLLEGGAGNDLIKGGSDRDTATYANAAAAVAVNLALITAQATGGAGIDTLSSIENLIGSAYADTLTGSIYSNLLNGMAGDDRLIGGEGADTLDGGTDIDKMFGGLGDDIYYVDRSSDATVEYAGEGTDLVRTSINYTLKANVENVQLEGSANIYATGNELANRMWGNSGGNKLYGLDGDDRLEGLAGNDLLDGGAGVDMLIGGTGDDIYYVDNALDKIIENAGEGTETVRTLLNYTLRDNIERLELLGSDNLTGYGNALDNMLTGNSGANILYGRDGNDKLYGKDGADVLKGEVGNDWLEGGTGRDRFYGGTGADDFVFRDADFAGLTNSTCDQVHDFNQAEGDRIRLNLIDANSSLAGDQAFAFIGSGAFTGAAGELRTMQSGGNTYVQGDTNGDGVADFMIRLDGLHSLGSGDFVL